MKGGEEWDPTVTENYMQVWNNKLNINQTNQLKRIVNMANKYREECRYIFFLGKKNSRSTKSFLGMRDNIYVFAIDLWEHKIYWIKATTIKKNNVDAYNSESKIIKKHVSIIIYYLTENINRTNNRRPTYNEKDSYYLYETKFKYDYKDYTVKFCSYKSISFDYKKNGSGDLVINSQCEQLMPTPNNQRVINVLETTPQKITLNDKPYCWAHNILVVNVIMNKQFQNHFSRQ